MSIPSTSLPRIPLFACSLGFRRTLKIAARTLSDVVTRVRLCGHHTRRGSRGVSEVQSRAVVRRRAVMRRRGEGGDWCCIDCVLKIPDERDPDTQRVPPKFRLKTPRP